jgi:hypothetical protein
MTRRIVWEARLSKSALSLLVVDVGDGRRELQLCPDFGVEWPAERGTGEFIRIRDLTEFEAKLLHQAIEEAAGR